MKKRIIGMTLLLAAVLVFLSVCSKDADKKGAELNLTLLPETITDSLYVKMSYQLALSDEFEGLSEDYRIFVHFWRVKNKEMLLVDDHQPEKKIGEWKKGDKIN
jgi:hypothetical protein